MADIDKMPQPPPRESNGRSEIERLSMLVERLQGECETLRLQLGKPAGLPQEGAKRQRFQVLAGQWKEETGHLSSAQKKAVHTAYQKIIGMGEPAIRFILNDLSENGPDDWFWALTMLTDENPITEEIAGNMAKMTEAWLQWGRRRGILTDSL